MVCFHRRIGWLAIDIPGAKNVTYKEVMTVTQHAARTGRDGSSL